MPTTSPESQPLEMIDNDALVTVAGGNLGQLASSIGGLVDQFAGTGGKATEIANQVGGLISSFTGK